MELSSFGGYEVHEGKPQMGLSRLGLLRHHTWTPYSAARRFLSADETSFPNRGPKPTHADEIAAW